MKKLILPFIALTAIIISAIGFKPATTAMSFETVSSEVQTSSLLAYSKDGIIIDSTTANVIGRFGVIGNPYTKGEMFTAYAIIKVTVKGDARVSDFQKQARVSADNYRKKHYPDIP